MSAVPTSHQRTAPDASAPRRVVELDVGETKTVALAEGGKTKVRLVAVTAQHDTLSGAVRSAQVQLEVDGHAVALGCGNYHLPVTVGRAQVDCPAIQAYYRNARSDAWGLSHDARLRLWPAGRPWMPPGTFAYPLDQRWFASGTQMANEPTFVDGGDTPERKRIYYHSDLDFGGCEGLVDVRAATGGLLVSVAARTLSGHRRPPVSARHDVVYLLDERGWYHRYSHLHSIDGGIRLGDIVRPGQPIGKLGKEGASGGWAHLHFGVVSRQPSGRWGCEDAYAYVWEAYRNQFRPPLLALARPHHLVRTGETVVLDASGSWCRTGSIASFDWTFTDGRTAHEATVRRQYAQAGTYSETLKITDRQGNVAYDFAVVQVIDRAAADRLPPTIHAAYHPSLNLRALQPVTFCVRTFRTTEGCEQWGFGDGSPPVLVRSDGNVDPLSPQGYARTTHRFAKPGTYLVRVERRNALGQNAIAHLAVDVGG